MYEQPYNPYAGNLSVVKEYFKNSRVLVMGILYIVSLLLSIVSSIFSMTHQTAGIEYAMQLLRQFSPELYSSLEQNMPQIYNAVQSTGSVGSITSLVFTCLIVGLFAAAYFIIYSRSRNSAPQSTPQSGFTILRVFAVITLVLTIIALVFAAAFIAILLASVDTMFREQGISEVAQMPDGSYVNFRQLINIVLISLAIVLVIVAIYTLIYTINRVRYYGAVKNSLNTVDLDNRGAKGYGVMCIITAILSIFSTLGNLASVFTVRGDYQVMVILSLAANIVTVVMLMIEGSLALGYRKHIDSYKYGYNDTPYGGYQDPSFVPAPDNDPYAASGQDSYAGYSAEQQPTPNYGESYAGYEDNGAGSAYSENYGDYAQQQPADEKPAVCPNCGAPTGNYPFCSKCGTKL